jgi:hypothetical protein
MLQYLFGGYIAGLVCLVFSIWWLRKTHPHQIYLIWLSFSFFFVVFLLVSFYTGDLGHYPIVKAAFDYLTDIDTEVKLVASAIALVIAPQALTYFLCGLSGSASPPKFVANVTDFMIWSLIKSLSACSGIFLAIFISGFWGLGLATGHQEARCRREPHGGFVCLYRRDVLFSFPHWRGILDCMGACRCLASGGLH